MITFVFDERKSTIGYGAPRRTGGKEKERTESRNRTWRGYTRVTGKYRKVFMISN